MDTPRTSTRQRKVQDYSALAKGLDSEKATKQKSGIPVPLKKPSSALAKGLDSTEKAKKQKSGIPAPLKKRQFEKKQPSSTSATSSSSVASTSRVPITGATPKDQLISKCPFGIVVWTKNQRNYFWISALKFFVPSWGLPGSFLGLPVGFLVYDITY